MSMRRPSLLVSSLHTLVSSSSSTTATATTATTATTTAAATRTASSSSTCALASSSTAASPSLSASISSSLSFSFCPARATAPALTAAATAASASAPATTHTPLPFTAPASASAASGRRFSSSSAPTNSQSLRFSTSPRLRSPSNSLLSPTASLPSSPTLFHPRHCTSSITSRHSGTNHASAFVSLASSRRPRSDYMPPADPLRRSRTSSSSSPAPASLSVPAPLVPTASTWMVCHPSTAASPSDDLHPSSTSASSSLSPMTSSPSPPPLPPTPTPKRPARPPPLSSASSTATSSCSSSSSAGGSSSGPGANNVFTSSSSSLASSNSSLFVSPGSPPGSPPASPASSSPVGALHFRLSHSISTVTSTNDNNSNNNISSSSSNNKNSPASTTSTTTTAPLPSISPNLQPPLEDPLLLHHTSPLACTTDDSSASPSPPHSSSSSSSPSPGDQQPQVLSAAAVAAAAAAAAAAAGTSGPESAAAAAAAARQDSDAALSTSTITSTDSDRSPTSTATDDDSAAAAPEPDRLAFRAGVVCIPHPDKADKGGEDAYFVQGRALGVFDGVGGWSSIGVDPGLYSKELARLTASYIARDGPAASVEALRAATDHNRAIGSSTACVVGLDANHLAGVNLGDSGLIIIRGGGVVYRTSEQQHYFNCPFQIGTDSFDTVDAGAPIDFVLQHGDCIVMGTDGLWDNVFTDRIVGIVAQHYNHKDGMIGIEAKGSSAEDKPKKMGKERADGKKMMAGTDSEDEDGATSMLSELDGMGGNAMMESFSSSASGSSSSSTSSISRNSIDDDDDDDDVGLDKKHKASKGKEHEVVGKDADEQEEDEEGRVAQKIAQSLADAAIEVANDERGTSPFAVNARQAGHIFFGGKVDDITIISAIVVDAEQLKASGRSAGALVTDATTGMAGLGDIGLVGPRRGADLDGGTDNSMGM